ncbi:MAG: DUF1697 domain-containing protein, partial [Rhodobiaceae bacterium]|nr:DUF1697 domain-containing protein [Rhodobiaceae bacterium]
MTAFVALLRGINVGGHGKLAMTELADLCRALGHGDVRTYIQSGNVVFSSPAPEKAVKAGMEQALRHRMGKPVAAMVRTG